jgi:hypothetical protein
MKCQRTTVQTATNATNTRIASGKGRPVLIPGPEAPSTVVNSHEAQKPKEMSLIPVFRGKKSGGQLADRAPSACRVADLAKVSFRTRRLQGMLLYIAKDCHRYGVTQDRFKKQASRQVVTKSAACSAGFRIPKNMKSHLAEVRDLALESDRDYVESQIWSNRGKRPASPSRTSSAARTGTSGA